MISKYVAGIFLSVKKRMPLYLALGLSIAASVVYAADSAPKATYYRYYDSRGVATISRSVTAAHIQRGYDVLDRNMVVLRHVPAYDVHRDLSGSGQRQILSEQAKKDQQFKRAYRNVAHAQQKKLEALSLLQKQINQYNQQRQQLLKTQAQLAQQQAYYRSRHQAIPAEVTRNLNSSAAALRNNQAILAQLQQSYALRQREFDFIISRLQRLE